MYLLGQAGLAAFEVCCVCFDGAVSYTVALEVRQSLFAMESFD